MDQSDDGAESHDPKLLELGDRLRLARQNAGLLQEEACRQLGCTTRSLTRWENGECDPGYGNLVALAELLKVSLDWLAGRTSVGQLLEPGQVVIDVGAMDLIKRLVESGKSLNDVPQHLVRHPGVDYAFVVPEKLMVMGIDAARAIDAQMRALLKQLGGRRR
jgi:transcriptional regulator with XRE-family HTH domain